jgi:hypothetical protein
MLGIYRRRLLLTDPIILFALECVLRRFQAIGGHVSGLNTLGGNVMKSDLCDACEEVGKPVERVLALTDDEGVLLDRVCLCHDCWQNCKITIHDKTLEY